MASAFARHTGAQPTFLGPEEGDAEHLRVLPAAPEGKLQAPPARTTRHPWREYSWQIAEIVNDTQRGNPMVRVGRKQYEVAARSLYVFPLRGSCCMGRLRLRVISLVQWSWFDKFILFLIFVNSVLLAAYQYREDNKSGLNWFVDTIAEPIFTAFCAIEFVLKVIAWGLMCDRNSYFREPWNILDFLVVFTAILALLFKTESGTSFLRMFRVLRPLRSLQAVPQMKVLVNTVLSSIPRLGNVSVMGAFLFVVAGIIGITLYHGMYFNGCRETEQPVLLLGTVGEMCWSWSYTGDDRLCGGAYDCKDPPEGVAAGFCGGPEDSPNEGVRPVFPGGRRGFPWCSGSEPRRMFPETDFVHFDHMGGALLSVFQSMTLEGWTEFMYYAQDGKDLWTGTVYYLLLVFIASFTLLNVALAVVDEARHELDKDGRLTEGRAPSSARSSRSSGGASSRSSGTGSAEFDGEGPEGQREPAPGGRLERTSLQTRGSSKGRGSCVTNASLQRSHSCVTRTSSVRSQLFHLMHSTEYRQEVWLDIAPVRFLRSVVVKEAFTSFIMFIIAANVVTMMMDRHPPQVHLKEFLDLCEITFLVIFTVEMVMLLGAMGPVWYAKNPVTLFDGFIVTISWSQFFTKSEGAFTALRTLRLFRVLNKLASRWPSFRVLLKAIAQTAISLVYWFVLFVIFLYILTLAAMTLFNRQFHFKGSDPDDMAEVSDDQGQGWCGPNQADRNVDCIPRAHFDTFLWAAATVFQLMTGENWNMVMYAGMRANGERYPWAYALFFIGVMLFGQLLFLSLFLSMLMSNFKRLQDKLDQQEKDKKKEDAEVKHRNFESTKIVKMAEMEGIFKTPDLQARGLAKLSKVAPSLEPSDPEVSGASSTSPRGTSLRGDTRKVAAMRRAAAEQQAKQAVVNRLAHFSKERASSRAALKASSGSRPKAAGFHGESSEADETEYTVESIGEDDIAAMRDPELFPTALSPMPSEPASPSEAPVGIEHSQTIESLRHVNTGADVIRERTCEESDSGPSLESCHTAQALSDTETSPKTPEKSPERFAENTCAKSKSFVSARPLPWPRGYAWFVFHEEGLVRACCRRILTYELCGCKIFDNVILFCILTSCVCMSADSPLRDPREPGTKVLRGADVVFSIIFICEMALKLLAQGLFWGRDAYLHSGWNWLDGTVVSVSLVYFLAGSSGPVKTLRILRAFRPLRVISRNENLKVVVQTIFASLPDLFTLVIVACLFLLIFALFATSLLRGRLYGCTLGADEVALSKAVGGAFVTPLCLGSVATEGSCPRGAYVVEPEAQSRWATGVLGCPDDSAGCAHGGANLTLAWARASADTPICVGRCDPFLEGDLRSAPEELCPRRLASTEEIPSACPTRDTAEYRALMEERWGEAYAAAQDRGAAYVAAMQRQLVMPCAGSTVDDVSGVVTNPASTVSCASTFCPWTDSLAAEDERRVSCRDSCRTRANGLDFCVDACDEGKDFSGPRCESCLRECEAACLCGDYCEPLIRDAALCVEQRGKWEQRLSQNFDNVWNSLLALFEISTTEGWVDVMYHASDATDVYIEPERDAKDYVFVPFFMFWLFFSYMFLINLSIGVIVDQFMDLRSEGKGILKLTWVQQKWIRARQNLFSSTLMWDLTNLHRLPWLRRKAYELIARRSFDNAIMLAIAINTLAMALHVYPLPTDWWDDVLEVINYIFAAIFLLEAAVKIYALRWNYFKDNWNRFDFLCVAATTLGIVTGIVTDVKLASFTSVIRLFRIARLFRLLRFLKGLNKIFMALLLALPKLVYTLLILLLLVTLFGILGVGLFSTAKHSETLDVHGNFHNFLWAFVTLFRASTGEAWNEIMHDLSKNEADFFREGSWCTPASLFASEEVRGYEMLKDKCLVDHPNTCVAPVLGWNVLPSIYWVAYTLIVTIMVLNLMVAVILEGYEDGKPTRESEVVSLCQNVWKRYDPDQTMWIPITDALNFIKDVQLLLEHPTKEASEAWRELQDHDSVDRLISRREERILETAEVAKLLKQHRMENGKFDLHAMPMRAAKSLDVMHVSEEGMVHFLLAAKQVMRYESVDNMLDKIDELAEAEVQQVRDEGLRKQFAKVDYMESKSIELNGAQGTLVTRMVAVTKIQYHFKTPGAPR